MPSTGLTGPYELTNSEIDRVLYSKRIGAYALGHTRDSYYVNYVGRSDEDLAARLKQHVGKYKQFKCGYYDSAKAAFEKECALYHDFTPGEAEEQLVPLSSVWGLVGTTEDLLPEIRLLRIA